MQGPFICITNVKNMRELKITYVSRRVWDILVDKLTGIKFTAGAKIFLVFCHFETDSGVYRKFLFNWNWKGAE
jgi:hypothetical protein